MKKLFSNPRFLHGFYGSVVILLLGYIYLAIVPFQSYEVIAKTMENNNEIINSISEHTKKNIDIQVEMYRNPTQMQSQEYAVTVMEMERNISANIDLLQFDLEENLAHYPTFLKQTSIPCRLYFSKERIDKYQKEVQSYYDSFFSKISDERFVEILKSYYKPELTQSSIDSLKYLPAHIAILNLKKQKSIFNALKLTFLNYELNKTSFGCIKLDKFKLGIVPNQKFVKVDEMFTADILALNYGSFDSVFLKPSFFVDGEELKINNGIAHFEKQFSSTGIHTLKASLSIKNILTGQVSSHTKDYTFEVLPK